MTVRASCAPRFGLLPFTDRGWILVVVYAAFSSAVVNGMWNELVPVVMTVAVLVVPLLLMTGLLAASVPPCHGAAL